MQFLAKTIAWLLIIGFSIAAFLAIFIVVMGQLYDKGVL